MREELLRAIDEDRLYDYIADNYHKMSNFELRTVLLEVIYHYGQALGRPLTEDEKEEMKEYLEYGDA